MPAPPLSAEWCSPTPAILITAQSYPATFYWLSRRSESGGFYMVTKIRILVFVLLLTSVQTIRPQDRSENKPLVLKGATVIDGSGNAAIPDAVIVIEGDRIKSFGGKATPYPADASVVDVTGRFIIPGLVDSHVHFQPWLGEMFLNHG